MLGCGNSSRTGYPLNDFCSPQFIPETSILDEFCSCHENLLLVGGIYHPNLSYNLFYHWINLDIPVCQIELAVIMRCIFKFRVFGTFVSMDVRDLLFSIIRLSKISKEGQVRSYSPREYYSVLASYWVSVQQVVMQNVRMEWINTFKNWG